MNRVMNHPRFPPFCMLFPPPSAVIAMPYLGQVISHAPVAKPELLYRWTADILDGMIWLHGQRIAHLDIKPDNIVVNKANHCTIIDFGHSLHLPTHSGIITGARGTPGWQAPEAEAGGQYDAFKADIWSVGAVFCCLGELHSDARLSGVGSYLKGAYSKDSISFLAALSMITL